MNSQSNAMPASFDAQPLAPAPLTPTRPFYWSVRRELWEYRSVYLAPLAFAGVILLAFPFVLRQLPDAIRNTMALDQMQQRHAMTHPFELAAALIMGPAFIVSIFYSLDCLYAERRDRSILFWKSLPVSDLTAVLAKAIVPLVVLPILAFAITLATEAIMLFLTSLVLAAKGLSVAPLWEALQPFQVMGGLLYHLITIHMLWYAPLYAWFLLISAWARRAPFLWAILPPLAVGIFEKVAFHTAYFAAFVENRVGGGREAVDSMQGDMPFGMHLTPGLFLATPGLWLGLIFAAICLVAAARMRRYRGPI